MEKRTDKAEQAEQAAEGGRRNRKGDGVHTPGTYLQLKDKGLTSSDLS